MERVRQIVRVNGLQIPLLVTERYGLNAGAGVVLELDEKGIHILPAALNQMEIENRALRFVLTRLGDATTIKAERNNDAWRVNVYGTGATELLGQLTVSADGQILLEHSTPVEEMRRKASALE